MKIPLKTLLFFLILSWSHLFADGVTITPINSNVLSPKAPGDIPQLLVFKIQNSLNKPVQNFTLTDFSNTNILQLATSQVPYTPDCGNKVPEGDGYGGLGTCYITLQLTIPQNYPDGTFTEPFIIKWGGNGKDPVYNSRLFDIKFSVNSLVSFYSVSTPADQTVGAGPQSLTYTVNNVGPALNFTAALTNPTGSTVSSSCASTLPAGTSINPGICTITVSLATPTTVGNVTNALTLSWATGSLSTPINFTVTAPSGAGSVSLTEPSNTSLVMVAGSATAKSLIYTLSNTTANAVSFVPNANILNNSNSNLVLSLSSSDCPTYQLPALNGSTAGVCHVTVTVASTDANVGSYSGTLTITLPGSTLTSNPFSVLVTATAIVPDSIVITLVDANDPTVPAPSQNPADVYVGSTSPEIVTYQIVNNNNFPIPVTISGYQTDSLIATAVPLSDLKTPYVFTNSSDIITRLTSLSPSTLNNCTATLAANGICYVQLSIQPLSNTVPFSSNDANLINAAQPQATIEVPRSIAKNLIVAWGGDANSQVVKPINFNAQLVYTLLTGTPAVITASVNGNCNYWQTVPSASVIDVQTYNVPITLNNCVIRGTNVGSNGIITSSKLSENKPQNLLDLTVTNSSFYMDAPYPLINLTPTQQAIYNAYFQAANYRGNLLQLTMFSNITMTNNYFEHTQSMTFYGVQPTNLPFEATKKIKITNNQVRNVDARPYPLVPPTVCAGNSQQACYGHFVEVTNIFNNPNIEIAWNEILNEPELSATSDIILNLNVSGVTGHPVYIHDNYVQGQYVYPTINPSNGQPNHSTGSLINTSEGDNSAYILTQNNVGVSTTAGGIIVPGGSNITTDSNRVVASGLIPSGPNANAVLPNGLLSDNIITLHLWHYSSNPVSNVLNVANNNLLGGMKIFASSPTRLDWLFEYDNVNDANSPNPRFCSGANANYPLCTNNLNYIPNATVSTDYATMGIVGTGTAASPITLIDELNEYLRWRNYQLVQANETVGPQPNN